MNFNQKCALIVACILISVFLWVTVFPQSPELDESFVSDKKIEVIEPSPPQEEFSNKEQALRIISCREGTWIVDGKIYGVEGSEFREEHGDAHCLINDTWYDFDYLRNRKNEVRQIFKVREKEKKKNLSFEEIVFIETTVCRNTTVPLDILNKIDSSSYDEVKIDAVSEKAVLISCGLEKEKRYDVHENEVQKIVQLVSGGVE